MLTYTQILYNEFIWNKEPVMIVLINDEGKEVRSEIKRLEFHYDAIDNDYNVDWVEPGYDEADNQEYLILHCSKENK